MTEEERREMTRSNYAAQMEMLGYDASGNSLDMVHVVRCRDCKYSDVIYDTTSDTMPLKCLNIRYGGVQPDWYCEHGEQRDGEDDEPEYYGDGTRAEDEDWDGED